MKCKMTFDRAADDCALNMDSLHTRHQQQTRTLFDQIIKKPEHCLHYLLPSERDQSVIHRLRSADKLPHIHARTNRFNNSFICFCVNNFQSQ